MSVHLHMFSSFELKSSCVVSFCAVLFQGLMCPCYVKLCCLTCTWACVLTLMFMSMLWPESVSYGCVPESICTLYCEQIIMCVQWGVCVADH